MDEPQIDMFVEEPVLTKDVILPLDVIHPEWMTAAAEYMADFDWTNIEQYFKEIPYIVIWSQTSTKDVVIEFCRFIILKLYYEDTYKNRQISPSYLVDEFWHVFLLFTEEYERFCRNLNNGSLIHHTPMDAKDPRRYDRINETVAKYIDLFQNFPPWRVWYDKDISFGHPSLGSLADINTVALWNKTFGSIPHMIHPKMTELDIRFHLAMISGNPELCQKIRKHKDGMYILDKPKWSIADDDITYQ